MPLNVSKGNMYGFVTHTFNTIKGKCPIGCDYCYMDRFKTERPPPRLDETEFNTDLESGNFIFVGSSCDMFAPSIPREWINRTLKFINGFHNRYLLQSKNPERFTEFHFSTKISLCTTIESNRFYPKQMGNAPMPEDRVFSFLKYVTIEPIMDFDLFELIDNDYPDRPYSG